MVRIELTVTEAGGGWTLSVGDGASRAERRGVPAGVVEAARRAAEALHRPVGGFLGDDSRVAGLEDAAGRALCALVRQGPPRFWRLLGQADARGGGAVVIVDAPALRPLPWELLADDDGQGLEATGRAVIARAAPGGTGRATGGRGVGWWSPTPEDPACAERITGPDLERPAVLHVVCHGRAEAERMVVELDEGDLGTGTVGHLLAPRLAGCRLLVLEVCESAHPGTSELDALASRLVAAGASSCLAPAAELSLEAAGAASRALHRSLARGATLLAAVAEARRAVRELALPHADGRWHNLQLHCGDYRALAVRPVLPRPEGLPDAGDDVRALVDRAVDLAHADRLGFMGFEHLVEALCEGSHQVPELAGLALLVRPLRAAQRARREALVRVDTANLAVTPRLHRAGLAPGFSAVDLCRALLSDGPLAGRQLPVGDSATIEDESLVRRPERAGRLEVEGGPEDGRVLTPSEGQLLGRHSSGGSADIGLYLRTACTDPGLSRTHLEWLGEGRAKPLKRVRVNGGRVREAFDVYVDDRLQLGLTTVLRGLR